MEIAGGTLRELDQHPQRAQDPTIDQMHDRINYGRGDACEPGEEDQRAILICGLAVNSRMLSCRKLADPRQALQVVDLGAELAEFDLIEQPVFVG